jgi:hypothetical protein
MPKRDLVCQEIDALYGEGVDLASAFQKKEDKQFQYDYQKWYTKALRVVASLAPDRLSEFRGYYEIDPKRKLLSYGTYVIQDYLKNIVPVDINTKTSTLVNRHLLASSIRSRSSRQSSPASIQL